MCARETEAAQEKGIGVGFSEEAMSEWRHAMQIWGLRVAVGPEVPRRAGIFKFED